MLWREDIKKEELRGTNGFDTYDEHAELFPDFEEVQMIENLINAGVQVGFTDLSFETCMMLIEYKTLLRSKEWQSK